MTPLHALYAVGHRSISQSSQCHGHPMHYIWPRGRILICLYYAYKYRMDMQCEMNDSIAAKWLGGFEVRSARSSEREPVANLQRPGYKYISRTQTARYRSIRSSVVEQPLVACLIMSITLPLHPHHQLQRPPSLRPQPLRPSIHHQQRVYLPVQGQPLRVQTLWSVPLVGSP